MTKDELLDVLRTASGRGWLGGGGGGGPRPTGGDDSGGAGGGGGAMLFAGDAAKKFGEVLGTVGGTTVDAFKKVVNQNYNLADAGQNVEKVLGGFGDVGRAAGSVLGDLSHYGQDTVDKWRKVSDFGASFSGDAIGMRAASASTRMTFEEYTDFLRKNKDSMASYGGSVTEGAKAFNKFSNEFFNTNAGDQLRHLGMTTEEVNQTLALNMNATRLVNMNDAKSKEVAISSAKAMATEMDAVAKLTGKSRQEQMAASEARDKDVQYQAMEKLALSGLREDEKRERALAIKSMKDSTALLGPSVENVVKEMATGGVRTQEAAEQLALLGPAGEKLQRAVDMAKNATDDKSRAEADAAMKDAQAAVIAAQNSKEYLQAQMIGIDAAKKGAESTQKYSMALDAVAKEGIKDPVTGKIRALNLENAEDAKIAADLARKKVELEQKNLDAEGNKQKGADTTKGVVDLESRAKDAGAAINENLVKPLNVKLGEKIKEARDKNGLLDNRKVDAQGKEIGPSAKERYQAALPTLDDIIKPGSSTAPNSRLLPDRHRQNGTLGETGKLMEDWGSGTLAMLHGKESVVTEEQMKSMMKGISTATQLGNVMGSQGSSKPSEDTSSLMQSAFAAAQQQSSDSSSMSFGGLSDLGSKLDQLNTNIMQLVQISYQTAENSGKQIAATKGLSGDLFA